MFIKTMTQYANEVWESWLVVSSFVSPAEVFNKAGHILGFIAKNPVEIIKIEQQKRVVAYYKAHANISKLGILMNYVINREYVTNA